MFKEGKKNESSKQTGVGGKKRARGRNYLVEESKEREGEKGEGRGGETEWGSEGGGDKGEGRDGIGMWRGEEGVMLEGGVGGKIVAEERKEGGEMEGGREGRMEWERRWRRVGGRRRESTDERER